MEKKLITMWFLAFAVFFVLLASTFVIAENQSGNNSNPGLGNGHGNDGKQINKSGNESANKTDDGHNNFSGNRSNNESRNASNKDFGKCVVEAAQVRQTCFKEDMNVSKQCAVGAKSTKDKKQAKQCVVDYKKGLKSCQDSFKEAKKTCIETFKPTFWARMRYSFA
jgi:hypothetical protein